MFIKIKYIICIFFLKSNLTLRDKNTVVMKYPIDWSTLAAGVTSQWALTGNLQSELTVAFLLGVVWRWEDKVIVFTLHFHFLIAVFLEESGFYLFTRLSIENHINPFKLLILMIYFVENHSDTPLNFNDRWLFKDALFWLPVLTFVSWMSVGNTCLILDLPLVLTGLPESLKPISEC